MYLFHLNDYRLVCNQYANQSSTHQVILVGLNDSEFRDNPRLFNMAVIHGGSFKMRDISPRFSTTSKGR